MTSNQIETSIAITVHADSEYLYKVEIDPDQISVSYEEHDSKRDAVALRFGSLDEMEAVARAMLKAVKTSRE